MADDAIEHDFPNLAKSAWRVTSPTTVDYNCIAWAAGEATRWWWPDPEMVSYWPLAAKRDETLQAFIDAFRTLGYELCEGPAHEPDTEKVALFATADGRPTHAARQLSSGRWSSKLGPGKDIEHATPDVLAGSFYGSPRHYLKRAARAQASQGGGDPGA